MPKSTKKTHHTVDEPEDLILRSSESEADSEYDSEVESMLEQGLDPILDRYVIFYWFILISSALLDIL